VGAPTLAILLAAACGRAAEAPADLILTGGDVLTLGPRGVVEALAVRGDRVVAAGGFGVPTLFFGDQALFGPVLIDPPFGDEALRLWNAVTAWLEFPHLYEIQRPKSRDDEREIAEVFRPYIEARDWVSINRGEVITFDRS